MKELLQRLRATLSPKPLSGRTRFVLVCMLLGAIGGVVAIALDDAVASSEDVLLVPPFLAGLAATLAYFIYFVYSLFHWVLAGFDEAYQRSLGRFVALVALIAAFALLVVMLRHEAGGLYRGAEECWYLQRDRWSGQASFKKIECPPEPRGRRQFISATSTNW